MFAGRRRARPLPTLAVALVVTALVAIPLTERVVRSDDGPAPVTDVQVMVDVADGDPVPLAEAELSGPALISYTDPGATAVSFSLYPDDSDEPILAGQDLDGPAFFPVLDESGVGQPLDTTLLADGGYSLFVTIAADGGEQRSAVSFTVENDR